MYMMIQNYGVCSVSQSLYCSKWCRSNCELRLLLESTWLQQVLLTKVTEHARLKDHVAGMDGGLEAKIHEGYVYLNYSSFRDNLALSTWLAAPELFSAF